MQTNREFSSPDWRTTNILFVIVIITLEIITPQHRNNRDAWPAGLITCVNGFKITITGIRPLAGSLSLGFGKAALFLFNLVLTLFAVPSAAGLFHLQSQQFLSCFISLRLLIYLQKCLSKLYNARLALIPFINNYRYAKLHTNLAGFIA